MLRVIIVVVDIGRRISAFDNFVATSYVGVLSPQAIDRPWVPASIGHADEEK